MIRRINYTGRKRIKQDHLSVVVYKSNGGPAKFDAKLELKDYDLPEDAIVSVEAYRQTIWMRFDFGTASKLTPPQKRELTEFESPDGVLFRVKVTSQVANQGKLLAEADQVPFHLFGEPEEIRAPLLTVASEDLEYEVSKVDFADRPILIVNSRLGDWRSIAKLPVFSSLVYPQAFKQILIRILTVEKHHAVEDGEDWRAQWLRYATLLPGVSTPPEEGEEQEYDDWIDDAVSAFCKKHGMLEKFQTYWKEEQSD